MSFPTIQVKDAANNVVTTNTLPNSGPTTSSNSLSVVIASDQAAIQFKGAYIITSGWTASTSLDMRGYEAATVQVSGLSGGDVITISRSLDFITYFPVAVYDLFGASASTISANGMYDFDAGSYIQWTKAGGSSTPSLTVRTGN